MPTASASVAHEGNPRTNSLTVSGTLDGNIFLIPNALPVDAVSGPPPPDNIVRPFPAAMSGGICSDVGVINDRDDVSGDPASHIIKVYSVSLDLLTPSLIESTALAVSHTPSQNAFNVDGIALTLVTGECLCGFVICDMIRNNGATPQGRETSAGFVYPTTITGLPMTGICFGVDPGSSISNFTGWVLLINEVAQRLQLMYYLNESLGTLPGGGIAFGETGSHIVAQSSNMPVNKLVQIFYARDTPLIEVYYNNAPSGVGGAETPISYTPTGQISTGLNCTAGLVWIGQPGSGTNTQTAVWNRGTAAAYLTAN